MKLQKHITDWLKDYCLNAGLSGYVIGVSGGIDSAVTSTLCALTELPTKVVTMPIHQAMDQHERGAGHCIALANRYTNVEALSIPLSKVFDELTWWLPTDVANHKLAMANSKARIRMTTLYAIAGANNMLVAGTGNKVEDFGVGFFTKGGDGQVDVSPIGSLTKTEVWALGKELGVSKDIIEATPTDGLHDNNCSDESQLGASYPELEEAMEWYESIGNYDALTDRQKEVLEIYKNFHSKNAHKMMMPQVCPHI